MFKLFLITDDIHFRFGVGLHQAVHKNVQAITKNASYLLDFCLMSRARYIVPLSPWYNKEK